MVLDWRTAVYRVLIGLTAVPVLAAGGCGGSDGDGSSATAAKDSKSTAVTYDATRQGTDQEQIAATMRYMRERFNDSDGAAFCAKLTASGRAQVARDAGAYSSGEGCDAVITDFSQRALRVTPAGQKPVEIKSVTVRGDGAVVRMRGGLVGTNVAPLRLRRENGEWKLVEAATRKRYPS